MMAIRLARTNANVTEMGSAPTFVSEDWSTYRLVKEIAMKGRSGEGKIEIERLLEILRADPGEIYMRI